MPGGFGSLEFAEPDDMLDMSHVCDPRNRPGYERDDPVDTVVELPLVGAAATAHDLRTVLLAWFFAALIVAVVSGLTLVVS